MEYALEGSIFIAGSRRPMAARQPQKPFMMRKIVNILLQESVIPTALCGTGLFVGLGNALLGYVRSWSILGLTRSCPKTSYPRPPWNQSPINRANVLEVMQKVCHQHQRDARKRNQRRLQLRSVRHCGVR